MGIKRIDRRAIIEKLKQEGYVAKLITYEELQKLHQKYGNGMSEVDFTQDILGVRYGSYIECRRIGSKVKVLKFERSNVLKDKDRIIQELKQEGCVGKYITYKELQALHQKYGNEMPEVDFAQHILGIAYGNYRNCKEKGIKTPILKGFEIEITDEEKQDIIDKLKENGYEEKIITYDELKNLYQKYGMGMSEAEFAQDILHITYDSYISTRRKTNPSKVKVLNPEVFFISKKDKEEIISKLKEQGYEDKNITYAELQKLHQEYGKEMKEVDFANIILGIGRSSYYVCKRTASEIKVLRSGLVSITEERKEGIIEKLKKQGYADKVITYEELQKLHQEYGEGMKEREFAQIILGVGYNNYGSCKNKNTRLCVLKSEEIHKTEEEREEIIAQIKEQGYEGKSITYEEFQRLYEQYGSRMSEIKFAREILGVEEGNYKRCKYGNKVRVKDGIVLNKVNEIKAIYLTSPNYYSKEYITQVCEEYGISIEQFMRYVITNRDMEVQSSIDTLESKGRYWFGKTQLTQAFVNKNINRIIGIANHIANSLCPQYGMKSKIEDYSQDTIIYIMENMGTIEKNYGDKTDYSMTLIYGWAKKFCYGKIIKDFKLSRKETGITRYRRGKGNELIEVQYADTTINVEQEVIEDVSKETNRVSNEFEDDFEENVKKCINLLKAFVEDGFDRSEAIRLTAKRMKLDDSQMLRYMEQYLIKYGNLKVMKQGDIEHKNI